MGKIANNLVLLWHTIRVLGHTVSGSPGACRVGVREVSIYTALRLHYMHYMFIKIVYIVKGDNHLFHIVPI